MFKGVPISPGIAVAQAFRIDPVLVRRAPALLDAPALSDEIARFDAACEAVASELDVVIERVAVQVGEEAASVFRAHRLLVRDPALIGKVKSLILEKRIDAAGALHDTLGEYETLFSHIPDEYLRERMSDIRDVIQRIILRLSFEDATQRLSVSGPVILIAREILPSQAMMFDRLPVAGIATEIGGSTGHAAILARSVGIPAVSGLKGLLQAVRSGDTIVLDGREGHLLLNPGVEVEAAYRKAQREYVDLRHSLIENRDHSSMTRDGVGVELLANVNVVADAAFANETGATGVGLFRTEYLFLAHASVPTEEEQYEAYSRVIEAAPGRRVTIRTLDLGGDKQVPYLGNYHEANPFMGWRSIRMSSDYPEFFETQLRAILRAGASGEVKLLFPMISMVEEVLRLKELLERTRRKLSRAGQPFAERMPVGVMIEVPAAALCIDHLLAEADFVSVGSNDLIQYLMAADRDNPKVAHLCEPFNPAVFRLLERVIAACQEAGKPLTLCGEMAARPRCLLPLIGMGLRSVSMSPAFVPTAKELVRSVTMKVARQAAREVVRLRTFEEVRLYLTECIGRINPNVAMLDTL